MRSTWAWLVGASVAISSVALNGEQEWYEGEVIRAFMEEGSVRYRVQYSDSDEFEYSGEQLGLILV